MAVAAAAPSPLEEALVEGVAGSLGGVLGLAVTYPLLATSTRLQLERRTTTAPAVTPGATASAPVRRVLAG